MQIVRWIIAATVFLALLFLSLQNAETVTLKLFQFATWQAPLVFVVFTAFAAGVAAGLLAGALRASRLKRQLGRLRREQAKGERSGASSRPQVASPELAGGPRHVPVDRLPDGL
jgi:uncharacterized integral membrane protein